MLEFFLEANEVKTFTTIKFENELKSLTQRIIKENQQFYQQSQKVEKN